MSIIYKRISSKNDPVRYFVKPKQPKRKHTEVVPSMPEAGGKRHKGKEQSERRKFYQ